MDDRRVNPPKYWSDKYRWYDANSSSWKDDRRATQYKRANNGATPEFPAPLGGTLFDRPDFALWLRGNNLARL